MLSGTVWERETRFDDGCMGWPFVDYLLGFVLGCIVLTGVSAVFVCPYISSHFCFFESRAIQRVQLYVSLLNCLLEYLIHSRIGVGYGR